jgi:hypothetical protein
MIRLLRARLLVFLNILAHLSPKRGTGSRPRTNGKQTLEKETIMWLSSLLRNVRSTSAANRRRAQSTTRRRPSVRPQVQALEARDLPSFASPVAIGSYYLASLMTADANGDGKPDLVASSSPNVGGVGLLYLNNGNGTFVQGQGCFDWGGQIVNAMAVGDVNGDGKLDFVFANQPSNYPTNYPQRVTVTVGLGNAQGGFTPATTPFGLEAILPGPVSSLTLADVYGNGKLDLVGAGIHGGVYVAQNHGNGIFGTANSYLIPGNNLFGVADQVTVKDLNGDGKPDIIVTDPRLNSVCVLMNTGNGTFAPAQTYAVGGTPTAVAVGDFNHDGKVDIVTTNSNGTVSVLLNNGNGTFGTASSYAIGGPANSIAVGDFNHDGYMDIATTGSTEMDVLLNNGNGTFGPYQNVGPAGSSIVAADFNGDGFPDLAELVGTGLVKNIDVLMNKADWTPGPQTHPLLQVSSFPAASVAGVSESFTVTALANSGATWTNYTGTVHFTSTDPQAVLPADYTFTSADQGVHTFTATLKTAGTQSITATDAVFASISASETGIVVNPGAATHLALMAPSTVTAGAPFSITVTALDAYGNVATGYQSTIRIASANGKGNLPSTYTFTVADNGVHAFTGVVMRAKGKHIITMTDTLDETILGSVTVNVV